VAKSLNLFDHDFKAYAKHPSGDALTVEMEKVCTHLEPDELLPGDIACFYIEPKSRTPQHIAIIAEDGDSMIHAHNGAGKVAETTIGRWASRIICGYRYPIVRDVWQP
jgi:cell wall-associated NlpC family hydrolase